MNKILVFVVIAFCTQLGYSQDLKNELPIKVMQNEINRSLKNLKTDSFELPFFLASSFSDVKLKYADAQLGALVDSNSTTNRSYNSRLMMGDYLLNDENFSSSQEGNSYYMSVPALPLSDDYVAMSKTYWVTFNNIYKSAARTYRRKKELLAENKITYPLMDYVKQSPVVFDDRMIYGGTGTEIMASQAKAISKHAAQLPGIIDSYATSFQLTASNYFTNSEGTMVKQKLGFSGILVDVEFLNDDNSIESFALNYNNLNYRDLPSVETINNDITKQYNSIKEEAKAEVLDDSYYGPILLEGQASANFFIAQLLTSGSKLKAKRSNFRDGTQSSITKFFNEFEEDLSLDDTIVVGTNDLDVSTYSSLSEFNGVELIGSFEIDGEGVVPPGKLELVKNGAVVSQLNTRIPVPLAQKPNGHYRNYVTFNGVNRFVAPGVVKVEYSNSKNEEAVKQLYYYSLKKAGLKEGLFVKGTAISTNSQPLEYYLSNSKSKESERIYQNSVNLNMSQGLKKVEAVSSEYFVCNLFYKGGVASNSSGGVPISVIVPKWVLVNNVTVNPTKKNPRFVEYNIARPITN